MDLPSITGMSNIVPSPNNIHQSLKSLNSLSISHSELRFRYNNYSVWFKEHCLEQLVANGRYSDSLPKGIHFDQFQNQIPKSTACLPQYIDIVNTVGHELLLIGENLVFLLLIPFQKFCSLIA
jgi:hypothetical protein